MLLCSSLKAVIVLVTVSLATLMAAASPSGGQDALFHLSGDDALATLADSALAAPAQPHLHVYSVSFNLTADWTTSEGDDVAVVAIESVEGEYAEVVFDADGGAEVVDDPFTPVSSPSPSSTLVFQKFSRPAPSAGLDAPLLLDESPLTAPQAVLKPVLDRLASWLRIENLVWITWLISVSILTGVCVFCFEWTLYLA